MKIIFISNTSRICLLYIWILIFALILLQNKTYSQGNPREDKKHYFCNGYLFDSDYRLTVTDISLICNKLSYDNRFFISIQKNIPYFSGKADDNIYTRDTEELFFSKCRNLNASICNYGFIISIYTEPRKIRIVAGSISKNVVTIQMRDNVIQNLKQFLTIDRFYDAVSRGIDLLQSYSQNSYNVNPNPIKPTNITPVPQAPPKKRESGWGFFSILIFIICPILCICGAIYYFYNQKQAEETRISIQRTSYNSEHVHNHLNQLESILTSIKYNSPPYLNIDVCLICMQKILAPMNLNYNYGTYNPPNTQSQIEMNNVINPYSNNNQQYPAPLIGPNTDPNNTRFACGHVYHTNCLNSHGINSCLMCNDQYNSSTKVLNTNSNQIVDEYNIKKLISKFDTIYDRNCLKSYGEAYPEEVNRYDAALGLGLVAVVGITAVATTAIVADAMSHNYSNNQYNNAYNQGYYDANQTNYNYQGGQNYPNQNHGDFVGDDNPDTAEGDY